MRYGYTFQVFHWERHRRGYLNFVKRNHISIWNWIQWYKPKKILQKKGRVSEFIIDETLLKVRENYVWLWVAIN
jgi:transposase-like protein